jgi:hypothetical protein
MSEIQVESIFQTSVRRAKWRSNAAKVIFPSLLIASAFFPLVPSTPLVRKFHQQIALFAPSAQTEFRPLATVHEIPDLTIPIKAPVTLAIVSPVPRPKIVETPETNHLPITRSTESDLPNVPGGPELTAKLSKTMPAEQEVIVGALANTGPVGAAALPCQATRALARVGAYNSSNWLDHDSSGDRALNSSRVLKTRFDSLREKDAPARSLTSTGVHSAGSTDAFPILQPNRNADIDVGSTPVEILVKPKRVFTAEALELRFEGETCLQVVFPPNGSIRVVGVVRGPGQGLDDALHARAIRHVVGTITVNFKVDFTNA